MVRIKGFLPTILLTMFLISFGCKTDNQPALQALDLMSYDMPIVINAPEGAEIEKLDLVVQKDITVRKGEEYYVQIFESNVETRDVSKIKERLLNDVQANPYFDSMIKEEAAGFVYKSKFDSVNTNYGFRHIRIQGDKEYVFQTGLVGSFSLEQVEHMYNAVK